METQNPRDEKLWRIAQQRASFKRQLISYVLLNSFLWLIWWLGGYHAGVPWPVWPMAGWGLALAFQYFNAYGSDKKSLAEKEYERLKEKRAD